VMHVNKINRYIAFKFVSLIKKILYPNNPPAAVWLSADLEVLKSPPRMGVLWSAIISPAGLLLIYRSIEQFCIITP